MVTKGEGLPKIVTVLKVRKGVPTKIEVDGWEYALVPQAVGKGKKNGK